LLELPEVMQNALIRGQIQMGHAKILLSIPSEKDRQSLFEKIAEDRLSVRELELARESIGDSGRGDRRDGPAGSKKRSGARKPANVTGLEEELSRALGTKVTIAEKKGRGVLRIEFYGPEDFNHLRKLLLSAHK
jgi:ParB family chromosome partitioning protein